MAKSVVLNKDMEKSITWNLQIIEIGGIVN